MPVRAGIVHGPVGAAFAPASGELESAVVSPRRRVQQARKGPLSRLAVIGRQGKVLVLHPWVLAERPLERVHGGEDQKTPGNNGSGPAEQDWLKHWLSSGYHSRRYAMVLG